MDIPKYDLHRAENYLSLLSDKYFKSSFWNTMLYGFGSALLQNVFGLALALFLNSKFKIRNAVRRSSICRS